MLTGVVQNRRVLELGSGAGFLGLVMAALQMERTCSTRTALVLSDVNPEVLSRCRQNFHLPCSEHTQTAITHLTPPHPWFLRSHGQTPVVGFPFTRLVRCARQPQQPPRSQITHHGSLEWDRYHNRRRPCKSIYSTLQASFTSTLWYLGIRRLNRASSRCCTRALLSWRTKPYG